MPTNLEIKARIDSLSKARGVAKFLRARHVGMLRQTDTYFNVKSGRLKLRVFDRRKAELIHYQRREEARERISNFVIYRCKEHLRLRALLKGSLGILGVVRKKRDLYLYGSTRIHIDQVQGLGCFMELETPVRSSPKEARKITEYLVGQFGLQRKDYFNHSYIDLILAKKC